MRKSVWAIAIVCVMFVGCATTQTVSQPPTVDVTGAWSGTYVGSAGSGIMSMTLQQAAANVTGDINISGAPQFSGSLRGTVSGDTFEYNGPGGVAAEMTVKANEMRGLSRFGNRLLLQRQ
jgi:hypothetical protein